MAANEKYSDLGLDGLESETLLHDDTLSGLDDLDSFDLNSDLDLDDAMSDDNDLPADDLDNLDKLDYSDVESDNDAAVSGDSEPIASDMTDNDIVDYPDAIDTSGEPAETGDDLSDDDLDLSLEAGVDDTESDPVTPDISEEDIAGFASENDDDDDDAYGVDLKTGPVTIAFTQVIEPQETAEESGIADEDDPDNQDSFGDDLSGEEELIADDDLFDDADTLNDDDLADMDSDLSDDFSDIDELPEEEPASDDAETAAEDDNYDIKSDEDLEFDVEQDDALSDIDIDDMLELHGDDSGNMLNISMPHEEELVLDEEQNAFLSEEPEDILPDMDINADTDEPASDIAVSDAAEDTEQQDIPAETEDFVDDADDISDNGAVSPADELAGFDDTVGDLNFVNSSDDSNLVSDDDLNALEESVSDDSEIEDNDEELTEASLAYDVIVDEELAAAISDTADSEEDNDRITLDGSEDLGIDLDSAEFSDGDDTVSDLPETDSSLDEDLPDTLDDAAGTDYAAEEVSDESDIMTDEMPNEAGGLEDLDVEDIPAPASLDDDDEDETIGLSGDELDNILVDADMSEMDMIDAGIPPTDEEIAESINIPDDPSFEDDDEFLSDEELAASVTIPGESDIVQDGDGREQSAADNDIMTNGDLDLYENVDENGSIIGDNEEIAEDTKIISDGSNGVRELSDHTIVVPASDETLSDMEMPAELSDSIDEAALETDTLDTDDLTDMTFDEADAVTEQSADEDDSETIDLASFEADLEPVDDIADSTDEDDRINISEDETNQIYDSLQADDVSEDSADETNDKLKEDVKNVLTCLDSLFGSLPEEKIKEFAESKEFEAYSRLFEQLGIKH